MLSRYHRGGIISEEYVVPESKASSEVFVSYATADRERVQTLVHALEGEGLQVWWDRDIAYGESFHKVIEQALNDAECVIVAWTNHAVASEWVVNEASDARKRNRLVPVMLESVRPPLEFRHLQTADLSAWQGDASDPQFAGLRRAVSAMLTRRDPAPPVKPAPDLVRMERREWPIRPAQLIGIGALLLGTSVLLLTLKYLGLIGSTASQGDNAATPSTQSPAPANSTGASASEVARQTPPAAAGAVAEPTNLIDTQAGARLIAANEQGWSRLFSGTPTSTVISRNGFAVLAIAGDKPVTFDTLAVFVDYTSVDNIKELAILTSSASAEGPFVKVAQVTIPNFRNMERPLHELHFTPAEARFVKLQVTALQNDYGPNGLLGTIQLYSSRK